MIQTQTLVDSSHQKFATSGQGRPYRQDEISSEFRATVSWQSSGNQMATRYCTRILGRRYHTILYHDWLTVNHTVAMQRFSHGWLTPLLTVRPTVLSHTQKHIEYEWCHTKTKRRHSLRPLTWVVDVTYPCFANPQQTKDLRRAYYWD